MFDLVEHLPVMNQSVGILHLQSAVRAKLEARASKLGYEPAGPAQFRVIELPLSMYLECRTPVRPTAKVAVK